MVHVRTLCRYTNYHLKKILAIGGQQPELDSNLPHNNSNKFDDIVYCLECCDLRIMQEIKIEKMTNQFLQGLVVTLSCIKRNWEAQRSRLNEHGSCGSSTSDAVKQSTRPRTTSLITLPWATAWHADLSLAPANCACLHSFTKIKSFRRSCGQLAQGDA